MPENLSTTEQRGRFFRPTLPSIDTALLTLSPAFLEALKQVAPKKRRATVRYIVGIAVLAVVAALGANGQTRAFGIEKGREISARLRPALPAKPVEVSAVLAAALPVEPPMTAPLGADAVIRLDTVRIVSSRRTKTSRFERLRTDR